MAEKETLVILDSELKLLRLVNTGESEVSDREGVSACIDEFAVVVLSHNVRGFCHWNC